MIAECYNSLLHRCYHPGLSSHPLKILGLAAVFSSYECSSDKHSSPFGVNMFSFDGQTVNIYLVFKKRNYFSE